jgi:hypothetical protein
MRKTMSKLTFKGRLPPQEEFCQALYQAMANVNPLDDLLELSHELREYEQKYQISSAQFYQQYQAGLLEDELQHCMEWATTYTSFVETKRQLETALMRAAVQSEFTEAAYGSL